MATVQGAGRTATAVPPATADVPARAEGVQLLGEMEQSGFKEPPCLAQRGDGQTIQLTELLYRVLEAIDGRRHVGDVAARVSRTIGKEASPDDIRFLVDQKLRPLGLLKERDGSEPEVEKPNPLLALRFRVVLTDERTTRRITAPFARLFSPLLVVPVVVGFAVMVGWLLFSEGVGGGARDMLYRPGLLVMVFLLAAASAGFHEFGHAAALRYGGGAPRAMGAGLYLVWPAFYTDVTDSYRLPRRDRLRTDLGGLYFNMVFALVTFGAWWLTRFDALLVVIPVLLFQMAQQLLPFVRLDGYHILADLTGVPDLFARIRPTLASLRPGKRRDRRVDALKPWVRVVVTTWVLAVVPLLLFGLFVAVVTLPRLAATAWDSLGLQRESLAAALDRGDPLGAAAAGLAVAALCLPVLGTVFVLGRVALRSGRWTWGKTEDRPVARAATAAAFAGLAAGLAFLWWPNGEYRPLQPAERGRVQDAVRAVRHVTTGRPALTRARAEELDGAPFRSRAAEPPGPAGTADPTATATTTVATTTTTSATGGTGAEPTTSSTTATTDPTATTTTTFDTTTTTTSTEPTSP